MRVTAGRGGRSLAAKVLAASVLALAALPAGAASDKPTTITMGNAFRLAASRAEATLAAGDVAGAAAQIAALQPSSPLETYVAAGLRMEVASRQGDPQAQRRALTDMLESKAVPAGQEARLRFLAAYYSYYLGVNDDALAQVTYARQLGYAGTQSTMLLADTMIRMGRGPEGLALIGQAMEQQRASGKTVPASWYDRAAAISYKLGNWGEVARWCQEKLKSYPSPENWRTCLANYLAAPGSDAQRQLDLYRLQAATGAMASERDYQGYAALAAASGYDAESKAVIEAGRAKGKLSATDAVTAKLLKSVAPKASKSIAGLPAQAKKAAAAATGIAALGVGDTYFSLGQYPQAAQQYRLALTKGGVDTALVNSRLGVALARSGDLAGGRAALVQANGPWSNVAGFWSVWVDQQAGQQAQGAAAGQSAAAAATPPAS